MSTPNGNNTISWAKFRTTKTDFNRISDIIQLGHIGNNVIKLKVIDKRELNGAVEFTFQEGRKTIRGVSFGQHAELNNARLEVGHTYTVKRNVKVQLLSKEHKKTYKLDTFTSKHELILNHFEILESNVNRGRRKWEGYSQKGICKLNQLIVEREGQFNHREVLTNVEIEAVDLYRYKGCDKCYTRIEFGNSDPGQPVFCPKCQKKGGDKRHTWKSYTILRDMVFKDCEEYVLDKVVMFDFNGLCERITGKKAEDFLFDGELKKVVLGILIGCKMDVTVQLRSKKFRKAGERFKMELVASNLKIKSTLPRSNEDEQISDGSKILAGATQEQVNHEGPQESPEDDEEYEPMYVDNTDAEAEIAEPQESDDEENEQNTSHAEQPPSSSSYRALPPINDVELQAQPELQYPAKRGAVLIVNNINFDHPKLETRSGSHFDVDKLRVLFSQKIRAEIFRVCLDVTSSELAEILYYFKKFAVEIEADFISIFFMSHGEQNSIAMSDGVLINVYLDLIGPFSDENFPEFIDKPKLIFSHACQRFSDSSDYALELKGQGFLSKNFSNIFICFPQLSGNEAIRFQREGTPFIHVLCDVFGKYGRTMDLFRLIRQMGLELKDFRYSHPEFPKVFVDQAPQYEMIYFPKLFYFPQRRALPTYETNEVDASNLK